MLLDILQIRKNPGVKTDFDIAFTPDQKILADRLAEFEGEAQFTGCYFYHDDAVHVEGEIRVNIVFNCDRCLKPVTFLYTVPFYEVFYKDSIDGSFTYESDSLMLDKPIGDVMLLNLPSSTYCSSKCKGLCPVCATDLNTTECGCADSLLTDDKNPFSSLKGIV